VATHAFFTTYKYAPSDDLMVRTGATIPVSTGVDPELLKAHGPRGDGSGPVMRAEKSGVVERGSGA
jgi:hypothetical protein